MDFNRYKLKCYGKENNRYLLELFRTNEYHFFDYDYENDILYKSRDKTVVISEEDVIKIREVIDNFNKEIEYVSNNYTLAYFDKLDLKIYYKRSDDNFDYDYISIDNEKTLIGKTIFFYHIYPFYERDNIPYELVKYYKALNNNPIYLSAKETNDRLIELRMKDQFSYISDEEVKEIEDITKTKYLKRLNKAFNKKYVIPNPSNLEYKILLNSGYVILHRAYFAMHGSTHDYYEINPYAKFGVDAAKKNLKPISFDEFLDLFKEDK